MAVSVSTARKRATTSPITCSAPRAVTRNAASRSWIPDRTTADVYGQDSFRLRPNLTLNLGVRWDVNQPWYDTQDKIETIVPGLQSTQFPTAPTGWVVPGDPGIPRGLAQDAVEQCRAAGWRRVVARLLRRHRKDDLRRSRERPAFAPHGASTTLRSRTCTSFTKSAMRPTASIGPALCRRFSKSRSGRGPTAARRDSVFRSSCLRRAIPITRPSITPSFCLSRARQATTFTTPCHTPNTTISAFRGS